jgi:RNA binding exosome subunit
MPGKLRDRSKEIKPMELEGHSGNPIVIVRSNNSMKGVLLKDEPIILSSSSDNVVIALSKRIVILEEKIKLQELKIAELEGVKK